MLSSAFHPTQARDVLAPCSPSAAGMHTAAALLNAGAMRGYFSLLRSLPRAVSSVAILKRFSYSSLPPLFASGRFAAVFYTV